MEKNQKLKYWKMNKISKQKYIKSKTKKKKKKKRRNDKKYIEINK